MKNPREVALELVENGLVDPHVMLVAALKFMSNHNVEEMLHANEFVVDEDHEEVEE
jgi:hypothetical protein